MIVAISFKASLRSAITALEPLESHDPGSSTDQHLFERAKAFVSKIFAVSTMSWLLQVFLFSFLPWLSFHTLGRKADASFYLTVLGFIGTALVLLRHFAQESLWNAYMALRDNLNELIDSKAKLAKLIPDQPQEGRPPENAIAQEGSATSR
jgi:hypothetical protein